MALLINFKDAVDASVLDPNATHAVYYIDGRYANEAAVRARCPHAKLHAITVMGATGKDIFACDSETGDLTIPQTETWVAEQVRLGAWPIVAYANQDRWLNLGLLTALAKYGNRIERWDADYDGVAEVPPWADAKQYASTNVDFDVARANFFDAPGPSPAPKWSWEYAFRVGFQRGFNVAWLESRRASVPPFPIRVPLRFRGPFNTGFQAGFHAGWK